MTQYLDSLADHPLNAKPPGWTSRFSGVDADWIVESNPVYYDKIGLRNSYTHSSRSMLSLDVAGTPNAPELVTRLQMPSTGFEFAGLFCNGAGDNGTHNYYTATLNNGTDLVVIRYKNGAQDLFYNVAFTHVAGDWYWLRCKLGNGVIRARVWADGDPEPATWTIDAGEPGDPSTFLPGGWCGVGSNHPIGGAAKRFDFLGVGTGGDAAPIPAQLGQVAGLQASIAGDTAGLTWNPVPDAATYKVERDRTIVQTGVAATSYTDPGLSPGAHSWRVRASLDPT
jgi:hypothetical protein